MEDLFGRYSPPEVVLGYNITQQRHPEVFFSYNNFYGHKHPHPFALVAGSMLCYLVLVYVVWPLMRPLVRAATPLFTAWRKLHNAVLFFYSTFCCLCAFKVMYGAGELDLVNNGITPMLCNENMPHWLWVLNLTFIVSKAYEWMDTAFIVWFRKDDGKGKSLTFLHVYHHGTTPWLFLLGANFTAIAKTGLLLNGFVHALCYAHYTWPFPRPLLPLLTIAQIGHLSFVTWVWTVTPFRCSYYSHFPEQYPFEFWTPYAMVPVYILFLIRFFVNRFFLSNSSGGSRSTGKAKKKKAE